MNPMQILVFLLFVFPAWLVREAYAFLSKYIPEKHWWWQTVYILFFLFIIAAIMLWARGYR